MNRLYICKGYGLERKGRMMKRKLVHFQGCLIGGAIGDPLGWPVEFLKL